MQSLLRLQKTPCQTMAEFQTSFIKNVVRRSPFGNFVSFPSEVIRNIVNITDRGLKRSC